MDVLLTGSVAYDYLMTFPGLFKEQILPERLASISLSFLVDSMSKQRGGLFVITFPFHFMLAKRKHVNPPQNVTNDTVPKAVNFV